jgi:hypothetical protein
VSLRCADAFAFRLSRQLKYAEADTHAAACAEPVANRVVDPTSLAVLNIEWRGFLLLLLLLPLLLLLQCSAAAEPVDVMEPTSPQYCST